MPLKPESMGNPLRGSEVRTEKPRTRKVETKSKKDDTLRKKILNLNYERFTGHTRCSMGWRIWFSSHFAGSRIFQWRDRNDIGEVCRKRYRCIFAAADRGGLQTVRKISPTGVTEICTVISWSCMQVYSSWNISRQPVCLLCADPGMGNAAAAVAEFSVFAWKDQGIRPLLISESAGAWIHGIPDSMFCAWNFLVENHGAFALPVAGELTRRRCWS